MLTKRESAPERRIAAGDPLTLLRQMASEFDRMFMESTFGRSLFHRRPTNPAWFPAIDVFEKENRLVTKIDLPGMKKEDVRVELADGQLVIAGERKSESEEKKEHFYRSERESGSFYRAVPLPEGVKLEDVKATFTNGVLEVSVPLPVQPAANVHKVEIQDAPAAAKPAA